MVESSSDESTRSPPARRRRIEEPGTSTYNIPSWHQSFRSASPPGYDVPTSPEYVSGSSSPDYTAWSPVHASSESSNSSEYGAPTITFSDADSDMTFEDPEEEEQSQNYFNVEDAEDPEEEQEDHNHNRDASPTGSYVPPSPEYESGTEESGPESSEDTVWSPVYSSSESSNSTVYRAPTITFSDNDDDMDSKNPEVDEQSENTSYYGNPDDLTGDPENDAAGSSPQYAEESPQSSPRSSVFDTGSPMNSPNSQQFEPSPEYVPWELTYDDDDGTTITLSDGGNNRNLENPEEMEPNQDNSDFGSPEYAPAFESPLRSARSARFSPTDSFETNNRSYSPTTPEYEPSYDSSEHTYADDDGTTITISEGGSNMDQDDTEEIHRNQENFRNGSPLYDPLGLLSPRYVPGRQQFSPRISWFETGSLRYAHAIPQLAPPAYDTWEHSHDNGRRPVIINLSGNNNNVYQEFFEPNPNDAFLEEADQSEDPPFDRGLNDFNRKNPALAVSAEIVKSFGPDGLLEGKDDEITDIEEMSFQKVLRKKMVCDVCMTHLKLYRCIKCMYSMCQECTDKITEDSSGNTACPHCREEQPQFLPILLPRF